MEEKVAATEDSSVKVTEREEISLRRHQRDEDVEPHRFFDEYNLSEDDLGTQILQSGFMNITSVTNLTD